ncbi:MAG: MBL fold metallo-hydrolase [Candidatus Izemoplasmatales bacterium]
MRPLRIADPAFGQNAYILKDGSEAIVIDPGFNGAAILKWLTDNDCRLAAVLLTHGHYDHIRDLRLLQKTLSFPLYVHPLDLPFLSDDAKSGATFFGGSFRLRGNQEVRLYADGDDVPFGKGTIRVIHTPGHTPGSVCLLVGDDLFTGDTLFRGDLGRTDLEGGSNRDLEVSIGRLFKAAKDSAIVRPGHDDPTTLGAERRDNPAVVRILKNRS